MVWLLESIQWYDGEAFASVHNCNSARMIWNHSVSFKSSSSVRILPSLFSAVLYSLVYLQEGQTNKEEFNCEKKKKTLSGLHHPSWCIAWGWQNPAGKPGTGRCQRYPSRKLINQCRSYNSLSGRTKTKIEIHQEEIGNCLRQSCIYVTLEKQGAFIRMVVYCFQQNRCGRFFLTSLKRL